MTLRNTFFFLLTLFCFSAEGLAQNYYLSGQVTSSLGQPIKGVGVFIKNSNFFSFSDDSGYYKMLLPVGTFTLYVEKSGYVTKSRKLSIKNQDLTVNFSLQSEEVKEIQKVTIKRAKTDRAKEIIAQAVASKELYSFQSSFSSNAYIKASMKEIGMKYDSILKQKVPDTTQVALAQVYLSIDQNGAKLKEERIGVKKQGDISSLYWLSSTASNVHIYENLLYFKGVSEVPIISPISKTGLISYRYSTESIQFEDNGLFVYKIRFRPVKLGNALGEGYLIIEDSTFKIRNWAIQLPKMHLPEYDRFGLKQDFIYLEDSLCLIERQDFLYNIKTQNGIKKGITQVWYDSFQLSRQFGKKYFGNMLSFTSQEAYERDSNFWDEVGSEPLSDLEKEYEFKEDSIKAYQESEEYKDSMERAFNKVTFKKVVLLGQGNYNHKKERLLFFQPLLFSYQPVMIGGARFSQWMSYTKQYENKQMLSLFPNLSYGFRNQDVKGNFAGRYLYDPLKRKTISWNVSRDFEVINPFDAWVNLFRRSNFFESDNVTLRHRQELWNGFFVSAGLGFSDRRSISNYDFNPRGDSLFLVFGDSARNNAVAFEPYKATFFESRISFTPAQKYMIEPYQKIILGSKWPTFGLNYRKGVPNLFQSSIDFDFLEFDITQRVQIGLLGRLNYRLNTGKFLQRRDLRLVDYVFQPNSNPYLFTNPNYTFQRLDSVYQTFDWFFEGHVLHRFNGAILNKIPLLKKLQMVETVGGGFLVSPENNLQYAEAFVGIEKIVKILEERFRVGVYLVGAQSNRFEAPLRFKFSIEYFNRQDNTWMF